jgi:hypothetical protein
LVNLVSSIEYQVSGNHKLNESFPNGCKTDHFLSLYRFHPKYFNRFAVIAVS